MNTAKIDDLATEWREEADQLRHRGLDGPAQTLESCADDLQERLTAWRTEPLSVSRAAEESGYSESHLYTLLCSGELRNAGRENAPRVRRCDLPRKGQPPQPDPNELSIAEERLERAAG